WSNIDEIHGDFQKKNAPLLSSDISLVSPTEVLETIKKNHPIDSVVSIQLIEIMGRPFYQLRCISGIHSLTNREHAVQSMNHLANAETGKLRGPLTKQEAVEIAKMRFNGISSVKSVDYLTSTNGHHEYRESPLPAYAITFEHPTNTTIYIASELGTIQKFRNNKWRIFDFLWMMHTMDYESRDQIGNWLLRIFSIFGLVTILSGFLLFFISNKRMRLIKKPN
ncbi:MAG: hypothetical protein Q8J87_13470, partial [Sediminibacterium sp.]|nr:hypothetical protein [Sediminibacterium sp.]